MLIIATFKHSVYLELALKQLEHTGVSQQRLLVAPLQGQMQDTSTGDLFMLSKDGATQYDKAFIVATIFMLLGGIYGFVLAWGPIIWALIGIVMGGIVGLMWDLLQQKRASTKPRVLESEVVVIVDCESKKTDAVERLLWAHQALGISKVDNNEPQK